MLKSSTILHAKRTAKSSAFILVFLYAFSYVGTPKENGLPGDRPSFLCTEYAGHITNWIKYSFLRWRAPVFRGWNSIPF